MNQTAPRSLLPPPPTAREVAHCLCARACSGVVGAVGAVDRLATKRPHLTADGLWRFDTEPSALRRKIGWDYRQPGTYEITLTLADRSQEWLGHLVCEPTAEPARPHGRIELTPLGEIVAQTWRELGEKWPGIEPREVQVMPEHFHGILRVTAPQKHPLGQIIGSFKAKTTAAARRLCARACPGAVGVAPEGGRASSAAQAGLWSPGLHDRILWNLTRYRNARAYLLSNPDRLAAKRAHPDLFRVMRDLAVELPGLARARAHFIALGNPFLLQRPLAQVQVSRRDCVYRRIRRGGRLEIVRDAQGEPVIESSSAAFARANSAARAAAQAGDVLISPCVSDGERVIARQALAAEWPLVTLQNKGFSRYQKPSGRHFEACAAGRLLMLAPAAWPYQPGQKPMTRFDATAMNRLCQWLVGEGAATINYHGLEPVHIDALARAAARVEACPCGRACSPEQAGEGTRDDLQLEGMAVGNPFDWQK